MPETKIVCAVIVRDSLGRVLLGKRSEAIQCPGMWCLPGGKLEYGETPVKCARRELQEETGISPDELLPSLDHPYVHRTLGDGVHCLVLYFEALYGGQHPERLEPDKISEWGWFDFHELPQNLLDTNLHP